MTAHILIIDNDEAFATILKEGIEMGEEYQATVATTASEARTIAAREQLAMAIVDMGLEDENPDELLQSLRDQQPELRLMIIPLEEPSDIVLELGIQGTLPKPFFMPDIPAQIEGALARPVGMPAAEPTPRESAAETLLESGHAEEDIPAVVDPPTPEVPNRVLAHLEKESGRLTEHLRHLSRELNADAVMLIFRGQLMAYSGHFGRPEAERLAQVVIDSWQASARVASALGREKVRFEQSLHEGEDYLLYSLAAADEIVLSVALRADRPLGIIRYNTKRTAQELRPLLTPR